MHNIENVPTSNVPSSGASILNSERKFLGCLHLYYTQTQ